MQKSFITIGVNSIEESLPFYRDILDFVLERRVTPAENIELAWLKNENGLIVELVHRSGSDIPKVDNSDSFITLTFQVDDLDSKITILDSHNISYESFTLPNGSDVKRFRDPNGTAVSFMNFK